MELRLLRTFVTLAETRHFGRAAQRLHTTPGTVSRQLAALERETRCLLLERTSRSAELTPAGRHLLDRARRLLADHDTLLAELRAAAEGGSGRLVVGMFDEGAAELTTPIVQAFRALYPGVAVELRAPAYDRLAPALRHGEIDALLASAAAWRADERFAAAPLFADARRVLLPASHPLADAEAVRVADLLDEPFARVPEEFPRDVIGHFHLDVERGEPARKAGQPVHAMHEILQQVALGETVITVTSAVERFYPHPEVVYRPVVDAPPTEVAVVTRRAHGTDGPEGGERPGRLVDAFARVAADTAGRLIDLVPGASATPEPDDAEAAPGDLEGVGPGERTRRMT